MGESILSFPAPVLQRLGESLLQAVGTPSDLARVVAESLLSASLAGHDSHGVMRLTSYISLVRAGQVKPAMRPIVADRRRATAMVDGKWGWGQPAARLATETAIALAAEYGIGAVTIGQCNHIGRLGEYVESITRSEMMGIMLCNAGPAVVPYGGRDRMLGTNPFAWAAPTADPAHPLLLDFATSTVAAGKLDVALAKGQTIRPGLIVDAAGRPSSVLADFFAGGALRPFGDHKGYAMSVMVELLGGALSGAAPSCLGDYSGGNGTLVIAFDIAAFQPLSVFVDHAERFSAALKSSRPAEGIDAVELPGDPEAAARRQRLAAGVPLPEQTWKQLRALAAQLGVRLEEGLDDA